MWWLVWFPIGLVIGVAARHYKLLGDMAWAFGEVAVPIFLVSGTMLLGGYGFIYGLERLAKGMRARDKARSLNIRAAGNSAKRGSGRRPARRASKPAG